jgi:hypothetical protein
MNNGNRNAGGGNTVPPGPSFPSASTLVTAGDAAYAWGVLLLVASMRRNGMPHPALVGAMEWPEAEKERLRALGGVTIVDFPRDRRCVACQKPMVMAREEIGTDWVCWADADGMFIGDCGEWMAGDNPSEIVIRQYDPVPPDFTPDNLETWRRDVERHCGRALPASRLATRVNTAFIVVHRSQSPFLARWQRQIEAVLPVDVGIVMQQGTAYFQTDESVLASLLAFDPDAPAVTADYKADGRADRSRYFAHFAYNPKPWIMWNARAALWRGEVFDLADWLVEKGIVTRRDLPLSLRRGCWPLFRPLMPLAPWVWRATKLKRKLLPRR